MRAVSGAMQSLFASRHWCSAKLFTFTLWTGTVLRYTSYDQDIVIGGNTYGCGGRVGPYFELKGRKALAKLSVGVTTDTLVFDVVPGAGLVEGFPFVTAVMLGLFDGADLLYELLNMPAPGDTSAGTIPMFRGLVGEIEPSASMMAFHINSRLSLLDQNMPRNLYQPSCLNTLYDVSCTVNPVTFTFTGAVVAGTISPTTFPDSTLSQATAFFNLGRLRFTSGANAGPWRSVQSYLHGTPNQIAVVPQFAAAPAIGDAFQILAGCDKTHTTCLARFSNLANFRGTPFVPAPETAV